MKLSTRRLSLRPPLLADVPALFEHGSREDVALPAGFPRQESIADARRYVMTSLRDWKKTGLRRMTFAILLKPSKRWIGGFNLRWPHDGVGEIGYSIQADHWGRGYAAEAGRRVLELAFSEFGAHRVQATSWVKNQRSAGVLRKLGLRKEGRLRGYLKRAGVVRDEFMWGITREDWLKKKVHSNSGKKLSTEPDR